jgi:hypothetical protein
VRFHFSEDPTITEFTPRESRLGFDCVWTIDAAHAPLYWFPRDCPRVAWWARETSTHEDCERWLGGTEAEKVIAIESGWLERVQACQLFCYRFDKADFECFSHDSPGTHLARQRVVPLGPPEPMGDLLVHHTKSQNIELRLTPSLRPLEHTLTKSTLHWSFIRMRNACPEAR